MVDCFLDLEVDVNGEEVFVVDKRVLSSYSGKISKLVGKSKTRRLKVIFDDFPGGAANFELITRFCHNKGKVTINPLNIFNLTCAAEYMEMTKLPSGTDNLRELTERSMDDVRFWSWSELLAALRQCEKLLPRASSLPLLDKCLDSLIGRVALSCETSPSPSVSSSDSSGFRLSCDSRSTFRETWWFEDVAALHTDLIRTLVRSMVSKNFDNGTISRFLFYYQKSRSASPSVDEKIRVIKTVVDLLDSLDSRCVSLKSLFGLLRVALNMSLSQFCRDKMEGMIGSQLDRATLDDLLVPSPVGTSCLYDVDMVLRFLKSFLGRGVCSVPLSRLKKVAGLMDLYLAEVAPDPYLKPSKFLALIRALPDSARDSCDGVYYAVNLYLEVHSSLCEEQKMKVCNGLNYNKLSPQALDHLSRNARFPSKSAVQAVVSQQHKLKSLLHDTAADEGSNQVVLYAKKFDASDENERLKAHLQGMQWRVVELEKVCRKMQLQMTKMVKSRSARSVPKLCK